MSKIGFEALMNNLNRLSTAVLARQQDMRNRQRQLIDVASQRAFLVEQAKQRVIDQQNLESSRFQHNKDVTQLAQKLKTDALNAPTTFDVNGDGIPDSQSYINNYINKMNADTADFNAHRPTTRSKGFTPWQKYLMAKDGVKFDDKGNFILPDKTPVISNETVSNITSSAGIEAETSNMEKVISDYESNSKSILGTYSRARKGGPNSLLPTKTGLDPNPDYSQNKERNKMLEQEVKNTIDKLIPSGLTEAFGKISSQKNLTPQAISQLAVLAKAIKDRGQTVSDLINASSLDDKQRNAILKGLNKLVTKFNIQSGAVQMGYKAK